ncbi:MAG: magnesium transporter MgtC [Bacilli bacterium]|nr:magnesium transporter MgtC [Bacilli bacterium]
MTIRLSLALILGGLIGFERERNSHPAGFRTNILVCLGSSLIMLLSIYGFSEFANSDIVRMDPARLASQVLPGIGFIGAGAILHNGMSVTGLTTAATLLVVAGIGLAVGAGFYYAAIVTTVMVIVSLTVLNVVEKKYFREKRIYTMKILASNKPGTLGLISAMLEDKGVDIRKLLIEEEAQETDASILQLTLMLKFPKKTIIIPMLEKIGHMQGITSVTVE